MLLATVADAHWNGLKVLAESNATFFFQHLRGWNQVRESRTPFCFCCCAQPIAVSPELYPFSSETVALYRLLGIRSSRHKALYIRCLHWLIVRSSEPRVGGSNPSGRTFGAANHNGLRRFLLVPRVVVSQENANRPTQPTERAAKERMDHKSTQMALVAFAIFRGFSPFDRRTGRYVDGVSRTPPRTPRKPPLLDALRKSRRISRRARGSRQLRRPDRQAITAHLP